MQTRKNYLPIILIALAVILLAAIAGTILLAGGVLAAIIPVRSSTPVAPIEATVAVEPDLYPSSDVFEIPVSEVSVAIGVGSPIPVDVVVAGEWPNLCAQLAQVNANITGQQISIALLANPVDPACLPGNQGLPFSVSIPLNMSGMPQGSYTVSANGLQTSFDWPPVSEPQSSTPPPLRLAFIGSDGNVWVVDLPENTPRVVTNDGTSMEVTPSNVAYKEPRLSSDGRLVAYRREAGIPQGDGMSIEYSLWVADLTSGETYEIYDQNPSGYNWKPGSHLLAYITALGEQYFNMPGDGPDSTYATHIMGYDADSRETSELVAPERGYALYNPVWSPDGRFLSFDEVMYYEGRGPFAYYDFASGDYIAWEQPLGIYSWSPDGEALAYDNLTYTATGDEYIFIRSRQNGAVSEFSPTFDPGYAAQPTFSPQGDKIAYLAELNGVDRQRYTLYVQGFPQGEPSALGEFENPYLLNWSPDGTRLILSSGPYNAQWITMVDLLTGEITPLHIGMQPSVSSVP